MASSSTAFKADEPQAIITLVITNGLEFGVPRDVAEQMLQIKDRINKPSSSNIVKLQPILGKHTDGKGDPIEISATTMEKILEWCKGHRGQPHVKMDESKPMLLSRSEISFFAGVADAPELFNLLNVSIALQIPRLSEIIMRKIADVVKGKTPEQIKEHFGLDDNFTEEEKAEILENHRIVQAAYGGPKRNNRRKN